MPSHPDRVRRNYEDPDKGKPLAQQQCKDCGAYGCLVPIPHKLPDDTVDPNREDCAVVIR